MWRRNGRSALRDSGARSTVVPSCGEKRIAPEVGGRARRMQRATVVLPQPLSPTSDRVSPRAMAKLTSCTARTRAGLALQQPAADREGLAEPLDLEDAHASRHRVEAARAFAVGRQGGRHLGRAAAGDHLGAARMEGASARPRFGMGHRAADRRQPLARHRLHARHRAQQRARVRMAGCGEELSHRRELDDLAEIHDGHVVGHLRDHAHVVRDQHQRHALGLLQAAQQRQNLRLRRDVERGGRLVGDQDLGIGGEGEGDADPLAQAAAQLEGIGVDPRLRPRDADLAQQLDGALAGRGLAEAAVGAHRLHDLVADRVVHAERAHRLLEDQADLAAAHLADRVACGIERGQSPAAAARRDRAAPRRDTMRPGRSTRRRMARAVRLLPQPLSPTTPSTRPACRSRLTPSSARVVPVSWTKSTTQVAHRRGPLRALPQP